MYFVIVMDMVKNIFIVKRACRISEQVLFI